MGTRRASGRIAHYLNLARRFGRQNGNAASPIHTCTSGRLPANGGLELLTWKARRGKTETLQWHPTSCQEENVLSQLDPGVSLSTPTLTDKCRQVHSPSGISKRLVNISHVGATGWHSAWLVRKLGSQAMDSKSELQDGNEEKGFNSLLLNFSSLAEGEFKSYLMEIKGVSEGDADFINENYPTVREKVAAFLKDEGGLRDGEGCTAGRGVRAQVRSFIASEFEGEHAWTDEVTPLGADMEFRTLGDMLQLRKFPPAFTGDVGLLKSMAILNRLDWSRQQLLETSDRHQLLLNWTAEQLQAQISVLESVGVKKKDIQAFVEDSSIFTANLDEKMAPMLHYLAEIGIQRDVLGDLFKFNPQGLINMPVRNFKERVNYLLDLGLSSSEVERCMRMFPQLVHLRLANLTQKVHYFESLGVGREGVVKLVAKLPSIFRHSILKNLAPKIQMLKSLGVMNDDLVKIMGKYPQFFGCSMENLQRKLAFFQTNGLTGARLVKMITWHPRAFSFSIQDNLMKKVLYLSTKGFKIGSIPMVRALVSCVTISTISLEGRFQNLVSLGFSDTMVREILRKQPAILCLSEKSVSIKVDFLLKTMGRPLEDVLRCPGFLLYGLESRTKPRHRVMAVLALNETKKRSDLSLSTILQPGEATFVRRYVTGDPRCERAYYLDGIPAKDNVEQERNVSQLPSSLAAVSLGDIPDTSEESLSDQEVVAV